VVVLALSLTLALLLAEAQPGKTFRVGFLTAYSRNADAPLFDSFRQGMRELGYEEGRNIVYQTRWAEGKLERLPGLAAELVALKLDTMLVASTPAGLAAKKATQTIPIVMTSVGDPVGTGLVDSLARPGGNITGNTTIIGEMAGKRLELLKQLVPRLSRVALLGFLGDPIVAVHMRHPEAVARSLRVEVFPVEISAISDLDRAFETIAKHRADGVLRLGDPLVVPGRQRPPNWQGSIVSRRWQTEWKRWKRAFSSRMGPIGPSSLAKPPPMWTRFLEARSPPICQSSNLRSSNWLSILKPPRPSA
jgi:putative ABC transport system substrate-binding protein